MHNSNSPWCLVLEISVFQYEARHGFRVGASVHKLFVGGVNMCVTELDALSSFTNTNRNLLIADKSAALDKRYEERSCELRWTRNLIDTN